MIRDGAGKERPFAGEGAGRDARTPMERSGGAGCREGEVRAEPDEREKGCGCGFGYLCKTHRRSFGRI